MALRRLGTDTIGRERHCEHACTGAVADTTGGHSRTQLLHCGPVARGGRDKRAGLVGCRCWRMGMGKRTSAACALVNAVRLSGAIEGRVQMHGATRTWGTYQFRPRYVGGAAYERMARAWGWRMRCSERDGSASGRASAGIGHRWHIAGQVSCAAGERLCGCTWTARTWVLERRGCGT